MREKKQSEDHPTSPSSSSPSPHHAHAVETLSKYELFVYITTPVLCGGAEAHLAAAQRRSAAARGDTAKEMREEAFMKSFIPRTLAEVWGGYAGWLLLIIGWLVGWLVGWLID